MSDRLVNRLKFAAKWTMRHFLLSVVIGLISAYVVFGVWYPAPFRSILGVGGIYLLILMVDVVCGPLLTFLFSDPKKSRFELAVDLGVVGVIQILALAYGMHAVWIARPVVLAFEKDRDPCKRDEYRRLCVLLVRRTDKHHFPVRDDGAL